MLAPRVRTGLIPAFHTIIGSHPVPDRAQTGRLIRLYWHVRQLGAAELLGSVQRALDTAGVPFTMKVLRSPLAYIRADAAVLYLHRDDFPAAARALAVVHDHMSSHLRKDPPLLTLRLARGLGLAEDPGDGSSFGQRSCRIVASAVWDLYDLEGPEAVADRYRAGHAVAAAYAHLDLDALQPHLAERASFAYDWPAARESLSTTPAKVAEPARPSDGDLLGAARGIGEWICRSARWETSRTRCSWIARAVSGRAGPREEFLPHSTSLSGDLYAGTAGIAIFLAQLGAMTGDDLVITTARGAMAHALRQALHTDLSIGRGVESWPRTMLGLYTGVPGILVAASTVSELVGGAFEPFDAAAVWTSLVDGQPDDIEDDVLSGRAGAILALAGLSARPTQVTPPRALRLATRLAEGLVARIATDGPAGRRRVPEDPAWTGLAHGAAGVSLSLIALGRLTGELRLVELGRAGFAYEDELFDHRVGNWPDFRQSPERSHTPGFAMGWCHGAPGIALTRLAAIRLDPEHRSSYEPSARAGIDAVAASLRQLGGLQDRDATLCHGVAGLVDVLAVGAQTFQDHRLMEAARGATADLARRSASGLRSGVPGGEINPTLMVGSAGMGYQLLRIIDPAVVPSVLIAPWDRRPTP